MYLTQVALGQSPRENEGVSVNLSVGEKTFLIGTLHHGRCDQIGLKLIFKKKFDISHSSKNASVYFCGYCRDKSVDNLDSIMRNQSSREEEDEDDSDDDNDEEDKVSEEFSGSDNKDDDDEDDDDDDEDDDGDEDDKDVVTSKRPARKRRFIADLATKTLRKDKKANVATSEDNSDDDEEEEEDEDMEDINGSDNEDDEDSNKDKETPKVRVGKRPLIDLDTKTPGPKKKAKVATPQGEGKKSVQFSTGYKVAKQGFKKGKETPGGSKQQVLASKKGRQFRVHIEQPRCGKEQ